MPRFDDNHVKLCGGTVVWEGVTRPEISQVGANAGKPKWTLKVVFPPHCPDIALFEQLAAQALQQSKWRGQLPAGGRMPVGTVQPGEFGDAFPGWRVISFKTSLRQPDVYDENGAPVDAMRLAQVVYGGQRVDVLGHCYEYDQAGNKGISAGLDAFAVIESAQAPRREFGSSVNTAAAFGPAGAGAAPSASYPAPGAPAAPAAPSAPPMAPPAQAHNFLPPVVSYRTPDGSTWTEAQLLQAGLPLAQLQALPRA